MPFVFENLTPTVRQRIVEEIPLAEKEGRLYISPKRLTPEGQAGWASLLMQAGSQDNEHWLAHQLENRDFIEDAEIKRKPKGGYTVAFVPHTASETLADGEFNRYYMIAVCQEAISLGKSYVTVYRAKHRGQPKAESEALIGTQHNPSLLIEEFRKLPAGKPYPLLTPNSGLSIKFDE